MLSTYNGTGLPMIYKSCEWYTTLIECAALPNLTTDFTFVYLIGKLSVYLFQLVLTPKERK